MRLRASFRRYGVEGDIGRLQLDQISQEEAEMLERPFTEEEIQGALMEMNGDKAPGPDGFTLAFWQSCWEFVKEEIIEMFKEFFEHSSFLKSLNNTFLVLIPRNVNAFVRGRQILDASLIANEVIDSWQKRREKGFICKLDIEKLMTVSIGSFFPSSKGLRQGDPLSPYLFVMGMEVLDVLIRRAMEEGFLSGCNIRGGSESPLHISHLFFADDTIIFLGEVVGMEELAVELGCKVGSLPSQYLGLPLGGRVTLIKSTLASMPIYQMSIFRMPKMVARRLEKVQRDFLWGGGQMEGKTHLVNWEVVCTDKAKGGLGIRKLALLNKALLGKWIWRYASDKDNLWKQVIKVKYGQEDFGWRPKKTMGAVGVGVWKEIWKESEWCWNNMFFKVGKGNTIRFWTDVWCSETALSHCFPHLFAMAVQRNATVEEMWDQNSDSVLWSKGEGAFRVKEAYNLLVRSEDTGFPSRSIWVTRVPTKVCFFAWEATWGRVLTLDRLQRRGYNFQIAAFLWL
ncbi:putative ribonuclease H protein [Vitis vinifera]|uniref:Putative ribonuclease H protein n=1 Tax=Vitis vinifera TaxID=29760 RepID=A0A438FYB5_VITVI|nr:putative ribonuclease H protein [Vitis vinifera]